MYKFFLCLRYLHSRAIAYFAVVCVALSVAVMVVSIGVMTGFLDKIEAAAKGLFGDIVIESAGHRGLGHYDKFIDKVKEEVPEVQAASPLILSYGILRIPNQPHFKQGVQIAGIRLPERVDVTDIGDGLFFQEGIKRPTFDPPKELLLKRIELDKKNVEKIYEHEKAAIKKSGTDYPVSILTRLSNSIAFHEQAEMNIRLAEENNRMLADLEKQIEDASMSGKPQREIDDLQHEYDLLNRRCFFPPKFHTILGLGISGLSFKTEDGGTVRYMVPGLNIILYVFPLGRGGSVMNMQPNKAMFTVVDDSKTGVWSVDSEFVWVPFETLQEYNNMGAEGGEPARCNQIHIKVAGDDVTELQLREVSAKIVKVWEKFRRVNPSAAWTDVSVQTWRQRQRRVIEPIESQRMLAMIVVAFMWIVTFVLVLVIFYIIVVQKTRDIGVLKSVGASGWGVASIFLGYGGAVGLVGAVLGAILAKVFIHYINPIHEWVGSVFGLQIWSKESYIFDQIPNEVHTDTIIFTAISAIIAGILGAVIPAIRAARMQPVEALGYE